MLGHYLTNHPYPSFGNPPRPSQREGVEKRLGHYLTNHPYPSFGKGGEVPAFSYWEGESVIS